MQITVHRGTHRIGGCITEIKSAKGRIVIDMGAQLPSYEACDGLPQISGVTVGAPDCDAVLITHYHGDHAGMFENILPQIPVYMGETSKQIYSIVQQTLKNKIGTGNPERVNSFKTFAVGKPLTFKDITVTPYVVDHSAFDAYMFLIEAEKKRILHTGDFRMHGARGRKMPTVFEKYAQNIDVLITEGTMLSRQNENILTEHELGERAKRLLKEHKYVFVLCSSTNIDTIAEFYNAAVSCGRPFIVCEDDFQAEILRTVAKAATSPFYKFDKRKIYSYGKNLHEFMAERGFCFICRANRITQQAVNHFPDNLLVYSMWRGYTDKNHPAYDQYKSSFLEKAASGGSKLVYLHTSGHAGVNDLQRVCNITKAKTVIPIHCEKPEIFLSLDIAGNVKILRDGEIFNVL